MTLTDKVLKYCAFQDRSKLEVRRKMRELKMPDSEADDLMVLLEEQNYVNDERFAESFIRGKINIKRWGRIKIRIELQQRGIDSGIIYSKMKEIDNEQYLNNLQYLMERWKRENPDGERAKMFRFLMSKGYTADEISQCGKSSD